MGNHTLCHPLSLFFWKAQKGLISGSYAEEKKNVEYLCSYTFFLINALKTTMRKQLFLDRK